VIQLRILTGRKAGAQVVARRFPFSIGRASRCGCVLEDEGIWEHHAEVRVRDTEVSLAAGSEGLVSVNGQRVQQTVLRNGDLIELASVKVRFSLSPTRQRRLWLREAVTWAALGAVSLGQVALIYLMS